MSVEKARKLIESLDGTLKVEKLSNKDIVNLIDIESDRGEEIIPVINEGVKECFKREHSLVLFKNSHFRIPPSPTLLLVTEDGDILGHDIFSKEDKEKYKDDENAYFLSDDFVIFKNDLKNRDSSPKKQYFFLPPVGFPELASIENIHNIISSSPSTQSDIYLKKKYKIPEDPKIATIIVSFSSKE